MLQCRDRDCFDLNDKYNKDAFEHIVGVQLDSIKKICDTDISPAERKTLIERVQTQHANVDPETIEFYTDGIKLFFTALGKRCTLSKMGGTFIGDPESWNSAKRSEYRDTVVNPIE